MNILKAFIIIALLIVTICTVTTKPETHKHFILESANFKLEKNTQIPENLQSTRLFKIGDVQERVTHVTQATQNEQNTYSTTKETKIIPSSFISSNNTASTSSTANNTTVDNSDETLQDIENMLNNNAAAWTEMERTIHNERGTNRQKAQNNTSRSTNNNITRSRNTSKLTDSRYRDELIAWNVWRSNIQNRIMDDSNVDAGYGTVFYFSFKVDKNKRISNIRVICTDFTNYKSINAVKRAIINLDGNSILTFPKNTNRTNVEFTGGFMMADYIQYSTPDNYNDYEQVRIQY